MLACLGSKRRLTGRRVHPACSSSRSWGSAGAYPSYLRVYFQIYCKRQNIKLNFDCWLLIVEPTFHLTAVKQQALPVLLCGTHKFTITSLSVYASSFADWRRIPQLAEHTGAKLLTFKKQQRRCSDFASFQNIQNVFFFFLSNTRQK